MPSDAPDALALSTPHTSSTTDADDVATATPNGFAALGLHECLLSAVVAAGYTEPTPVQAATIPRAIAGEDLMVTSATGSGKTAAFVLPALDRLARSAQAGGRTGPRVLVLTPTRELSLQVTKACDTYGRHYRGLRTASVVGGMPYGAQLRALRDRLDVLIATPGRLLDHLDSGKLALGRVEILVLDEADRMLDMGFIDDITRIAAATPSTRQTLLFSATLAGQVGRLAADLMRDPARIELATHQDTHTQITQRLHWADGRGHKDRLLDRLLADPTIDQAIVFTSTQIDAERVAGNLEAEGHAVAALHGGMPQGQRTRTLTALRKRALRVLVATDVAARGIDVPTISHVINYGLPITAEDYVHRIGRTGRAGRTGLAITLAEHDDAHKIRRIERFTTQRIPEAVVEGLEPKHRPQAGAGRGAPRNGAGRGGFGGRGGPGAGARAPGAGYRGSAGPGGSRAAASSDPRREPRRAAHHDQPAGEFAPRRRSRP
ncbi:MAG: DEAD/DEAH box helicase [Burkholderiales bacterium]|jgi:superfamily II DNA/RNA helicase|nr:DEAD/DEAH box helicase [Burkholderiales bacterium]